MHDTHMVEKIYQALFDIYSKDRITKIYEIKISISQDSHINETNLLEFLIERDNRVFGEWTRINIDRKNTDKLSAVIMEINGEKDEKISGD